MHNLNEVWKETQDVVEPDETVDNYLLARDGSRRFIKPPRRLGYADLIVFALIFTNEVLNDEESRD